MPIYANGIKADAANAKKPPSRDGFFGYRVSYLQTTVISFSASARSKSFVPLPARPFTFDFH